MSERLVKYQLETIAMYMASAIPPRQIAKLVGMEEDLVDVIRQIVDALD